MCWFHHSTTRSVGLLKVVRVPSSLDHSFTALGNTKAKSLSCSSWMCKNKESKHVRGYQVISLPLEFGHGHAWKHFPRRESKLAFAPQFFSQRLHDMYLLPLSLDPREWNGREAISSYGFETYMWAPSIYYHQYQY